MRTYHQTRLDGSSEARGIGRSTISCGRGPSLRAPFLPPFNRVDFCDYYFTIMDKYRT